MPKNHGGRPRHSKKGREVRRHYEGQQAHGPREAIELVRTLAREARRGFDETVEAAIRLGIDPRKADQMVRGTVALPAGTGKPVRVAVFATGDDARLAQEAGADVVGADDLVERIEGGFLDFDVAIAEPSLMPLVGKLGKLLGPRGLMPNPKAGTVADDVAKAVQEFKGGKVEYRSDRYGNVHVPVGKVSFDAGDLVANYAAVLEELIRARPAAAKGRYLMAVTVSSTMGPGVHIDPARARDVLEEEPTRA